MRTLVLAAALFAPSAGLAADPPIVFQTQPVGRLLDEARSVVAAAGGDKAVEEFNNSLRMSLGEKGFDGFDLARPVVGYCVLAAKLDQSAAVVALPVTGEKEFLDLCERVNGTKPKQMPGGLYEVPKSPFAGRAAMRFHDGHAYLCSANDPAPYLDPKVLVPAAKLFDPTEQALAAGKLHFDRVPKEVKASVVELFGKAKAELRKMPNNAPPELVLLDLFDKFGAQILAAAGDAKSAGLRLTFDPASSDLTTEFTLTPTAGTPLAAVLAAKKPTANRFGGLLTPDTVGGFKTRLPLFNDELRAAAVAGLEAGKADATRTSKPAGKAAGEAFFDGLIAAAKTGEADLVAGVRGPNKDGQFTFVAAFSFENPAFEKAFRKFADEDPPPGDEKIQWDADKAGGVSIHTYKMSGGGFLNPADLFGKDKCVVAFAASPTGVFVALGTDSVAVLKDALAVKPAASPVLDVVVNPARVGKMVAALSDPAAAKRAEAALGKDDKLKSAASLSVVSGKDLKVTFALNAQILPRAIFTSRTGPPGATDPPPVKK